MQQALKFHRCQRKRLLNTCLPTRTFIQHFHKVGICTTAADDCCVTRNGTQQSRNEINTAFRGRNIPSTMQHGQAHQTLALPKTKTQCAAMRAHRKFDGVCPLTTNNRCHMFYQLQKQTMQQSLKQHKSHENNYPPYSFLLNAKIPDDFRLYM